MAMYMAIHNHLVDRYGADAAHAFFNEHEADVRKRAASALAERLVTAIALGESATLHTPRVDMQVGQATAYSRSIADVLNPTCDRGTTLIEWADRLIESAREAFEATGDIGEATKLVCDEIRRG